MRCKPVELPFQAATGTNESNKELQDMLRSALKGLIALTALMMATSAGAGTYYVATNGALSNKGTSDSPWPSVNHALQMVGGGHTILVKPGVYFDPITIPDGCGGTKDSPTIIKAETKWKAVILGAPETGISTAPGANWVVIDGFEVMGCRGEGIKLGGNYNTVRNCYIHNNARQGIASHKQTGQVIECNLVEYNGQSPQFHHGVYVSGAKFLIRANVIRHNSGAGLNTNGGIVDSIIANNLIHDQRGDTAAVIIFSPTGGARNYVVNNTIVKNNTALRFYGGNGDIVVNNILLSPTGLTNIQVLGSDAYIKADYNLCSMRTPYDGPNTLTGDPKFVDMSRNTFWLRADSPAIAKGLGSFALEVDFWGRPQSKTVPPSLGAFAYSPYLTTDVARINWYYQWPYRYALSAGTDVPDFWLPPVD